MVIDLAGDEGGPPPASVDLNFSGGDSDSDPLNFRGYPGTSPEERQAREVRRIRQAFEDDRRARERERRRRNRAAKKAKEGSAKDPK